MAEYTGEVLDNKPEQAPAGAAVPNIVSIADGRETTAKLDAEGDTAQQQLLQQAQVKKDQGTPFSWTGLLDSPAAYVTGASLLGVAAGAAVPTVVRSVKDRYLSRGGNTPEIDRTIDIPMNAAPQAPIMSPVQQAPVQQAPVEAVPDRLKQAQDLIETNKKLGIGVPPAVAPAAPSAPVAPSYVAPVPMSDEELLAVFQGKAPAAPGVAPQLPPAPDAPAGMAGVAPPEPISTPLSTAPVDAPAPKPSAAPGSSATEVVVDEIKDLMHKVDQPVAPPGELRTGTGKPAFAGQGPEPKINKRTGQPQFKSEYGSLAEVPKGYAVVPNAQYIDVLREDLGQPAYTKALTGRDFPLEYEQSVAMGKEINRELGRPTRAEAKAAGQPYGEVTGGITKRTTSGKKLVTVGGKAAMAGALISLADLAKADTPESRMNAGTGLLGAVLPPGMDINDVGAGSSNVPSADPYMLLGSPYAHSPLAVKRRKDEEYTRKVGAGRGIAPPSAYMR